jgi:phage I-like protein
MTTRKLLFFNADSSLATDTLVLGDGSIWSHAATLGTRFKSGEFTIDRTTVENFVRVFATGYPQKVPVDYEHGTTNGATSTGQPVPKAGDVVEMRGVFAPSDFTGELKTAAEKLSSKAGRPLDDARNLGLWIRWRPTSRALGMIKAGEYSELSIAFDQHMTHNVDGRDQGPALYAVALTNLPFLDDMLPVAASRTSGDGRDPAGPGSPTTHEERMSKVTMLSVVAAILGTPPANEEDAAVQLQALQPEIARARKFTLDVGAAIGETDPAKAVTAVTQMKADSQRLATELAQQKSAKIKADVDATLTKYEKRLTPATKEYFGKQLTRELESGTALDKSETYKTIESLPEMDDQPEERHGQRRAGGRRARSSSPRRIRSWRPTRVEVDREERLLSALKEASEGREGAPGLVEVTQDVAPASPTRTASNHHLSLQHGADR